MKEIVSTSNGGAKYKRMNLFANIMFVSTIAGVGSIFGYNYYEDFRKEQIYDSLYMSFSTVKEVEYGSENDTLNFVNTYENGELNEYTKELDTSSVGVKELKYEISKDDVSKEYVLKVEVKDTKKPSIEFKNATITLYIGNTYAYKNNIKSVKDEVDGELPYMDKAPEVNEKGYYTITSNLNNQKIGTYSVTVKAVDKNGNEETKNYSIKVIAKPVVKKVTTTTTTTQKKVVGNYNGPSSVDTSSVVNAAKSLIGSRYRYGKSSPSEGFDCSGFVHYVYSLFGKKLPRTASGLKNVGENVSEANMQPGDIIIWSDNGYSATHVSIYIGGGEMIHAANRRLGVVRQSVSYWKGNGRNIILKVRRV